MKFVDEADIYVKAGDGGRGCVSFRREKYVPAGTRTGGNGGKGGDIIITASRTCVTLLDLKYRQHYRAKHGGHGEGSNRTGRNAPDIRITVPVGTVVTDAETGEVLADLAYDTASFVVARGGRGGKGNASFTTAVRQAPKFAQPGEAGEERNVHLELKLVADVGLLGRPNVGKSTFLSRISAAHPKIAAYPFTTLTPHLGAVDRKGGDKLIVADIPGLIEKAHLGAGMGIRFLRHIERTAVLLHIIDISAEEDADGWGDYQMILQELTAFNPALSRKPMVVAINKCDLPLTRMRLSREMMRFESEGIRVYPFSALTGEGIDEVLDAVFATWESPLCQRKGLKGSAHDTDEKGTFRQYETLPGQDR